MLFGENRPVGPLYEAQHLNEMIEIIDRRAISAVRWTRLFPGRIRLFYFCSKRGAKVTSRRRFPDGTERNLWNSLSRQAF